MPLRPASRQPEFHTLSTNPLEDYWPSYGSPKRGPKQSTSDNAGYFEAGRKDVLISPPGLLGLASLVEPDMRFAKPGQPGKFNLNIHWTEEQAKAFAAQVEEAGAGLYPKLVAEMAKEGASTAKLKAFHADPWLEEKLKDPHEKSRIKLPSVQFGTNASYINRDKETVPIRVMAWDAKNKPLDLPGLHMGMGSTVQVVYKIKLYTNGLLKGKVEPSLKLFGIRVLKLERYSQAVQLGDVTEADLIGVEAGFEAEDLSAFAMGSKETQAKVSQEETALDDSVDF